MLLVSVGRTVTMPPPLSVIATGWGTRCRVRPRARDGVVVGVVSHVAIGGSQLVFSGNPGKLVNGTGIYQGATGRTISSKEVPGMDDASDIVLRIQLAA